MRQDASIVWTLRIDVQHVASQVGGHLLYNPVTERSSSRFAKRRSMGATCDYCC